MESLLFIKYSYLNNRYNTHAYKTINLEIFMSIINEYLYVINKNIGNYFLTIPTNILHLVNVGSPLCDDLKILEDTINNV